MPPEGAKKKEAAPAKKSGKSTPAQASKKIRKAKK